MPKTKLNTVTRTQGNNSALKEGLVTAPDFDFEFEEIPVLVHGFRRMVRELAYDVCEMALTTYIAAKAHGVKFTALPIFLVREFHHKAIVHHVPSGLTSPAELAGRRVGVSRGYTVTTGVWGRAIMQDEYGVDPSSVTWVLSGDEHVAEFQYPDNVEQLEDGDLDGRLASGELVAAVGTKANPPDVAHMIDDPFAAGVAALKSRGLYPINHMVVVRDELLEANPDIAIQVFDAFAASKKLYVDDLKAGRISDLSAVDKVHLAALDCMEDPLPYGIAPNRDVLEQLIGHAVSQKIIPERIDVDSLFAAPVRDVVA